MKVNVEKSSAINTQFNIEIPWSNIKEEFDTAYNEIKGSAQIRGFRPGKTPRAILEKLYGKRIEKDILEKVLTDSLKKALDDEKIIPVSQPAIDHDGLKKNEPFVFTAKVESKPEINPEGYDSLEVEMVKADEVTEEQINEEVTRLQTMMSQVKPITDRETAAEEDVVIMDLEVKDGDNKIEQYSFEDKTIELKTFELPEELKNNVIGTNLKEKKEITISHDEDYEKKDLAGKSINYIFTLKELKQKEVPEINDDFAKSMGEFESLDQLRKRLKDDLEEKSNSNAEKEANNRIIKKLIEKHEFEVPNSMVDRHLTNLINDYAENLIKYGIPREKIQIDNLRNEWRELAIEQVKGTLMLEAIGAKENLQLNDDEFEDYVKKAAESSGQPIEKIKAFYEKNEDAKDSLWFDLTQNKIVDYLKNITKFVEGLEDKAEDKAEDKTEDKAE